MTLLVPTRRKPSRLAFTFSAGLLALSLVALPSFAQDTPPQVPAAAVEAPAAKPQGGDSIAARLSRVEQKLADLQALVGAFVRSNPGAMPPQDTGAGAPAGDPPSSQGELGMRVATLETQIGALTAELEQINQRLNALNAAPAAQAPVLLSPDNPPAARQGDAGPPPDATMAAMAEAQGIARTPPNHDGTGQSPAKNRRRHCHRERRSPFCHTALKRGAATERDSSAARQRRALAL